MTTTNARFIAFFGEQAEPSGWGNSPAEAINHAFAWEHKEARSIDSMSEFMRYASVMERTTDEDGDEEFVPVHPLDIA